MNPLNDDERMNEWLSMMYRQATAFHPNPRIVSDTSTPTQYVAAQEVDLKPLAKPDTSRDLRLALEALNLAEFSVAELEDAIDLFNDAILKQRHESSLDFDHTLRED